MATPGGAAARRLLSTHDAIEPADLVEFCPSGDSSFVYSTYLLRDDGAGHQTKTGGLVLAALGDGGALRALHRVETSAVFDARWFGPDALLVACADGSVLRVARCGDALGSPARVGGRDGDAATYVAPAGPSGRVCICHDSGDVSLCALGGAAGLEELCSWHAHDFQAWVAGAAAPGMLLTGGDDAALRAWDPERGGPTALFTKRFDADVTAVQAHPRLPLVAVGSYDQSLSLWDVRAMSRPVTKSEGAGGGGGVWRLRWACDGDVLLGACMQGGFRVWRVSAQASSEERAAFYEPHTSIAYGADWAPGASATRATVVCCSFYDHLLSSWELTDL